MDTGKRIKARRKQLHISAESLASMIGVAPTTVYRYESGDIEKVGSTVLEAIAKALRTTPAFLMGWESDGDVEKPNEPEQSPATPPRSKEWKLLSEGFERMEQQRYDEFMALFNMLRVTKPEFFNEGTDDNDT